VPTCAATAADTIAIPAGPFLYGGVGAPPSQALTDHPEARIATEQQLELADYRIDRTEVSNAAFEPFAAMVAITDLARPTYPSSLELKDAGGPRKPVTGIDWHTARAYCRYLGKDLPTAPQWIKAMRGGLVLPDGTANPTPRRNLPWGAGGVSTQRAQLYGSDGEITTTADVGIHPEDVSPYGVLDLTGNAQEWTASIAPGGVGFRQVRGGCVTKDCLDNLLDMMAIENPRPASGGAMFELGLRCAINPPVPVTR
jgi:formylglycine-generating enzyme required for sulfatase activity